MKTEFFEYFQPSKTEFERIWGSCAFSFDATVLLDLYRFSSSSREELLGAIKTVGERVWIAHQAAHEFNKHRLKIMADAHLRTDKLTSKLADLSMLVQSEAKQHPYLDISHSETICKHLDDSAELLRTVKSNSPSDDSVGNELLELLDGRVGPPYSVERLVELHKEIDIRYTNKIPPGYMDAKEKSKPGSDGDPYGDCVLWLQLIDYAKSKKTPVVFITRDMKEDWWTKIYGRTIQPRHELRREFRDKTGQDFYLYETSQFIQFLKLSPELFKEAEVLAANPPSQGESFGGDEQAKTSSLSASTSNSGSEGSSPDVWKAILKDLFEGIDRKAAAQRRTSSWEPLSTLLTKPLSPHDAGSSNEQSAEPTANPQLGSTQELPIDDLPTADRKLDDAPE